ncbi:MAG: phosphoribosylaminoimidazolecarboxamide formyltransferase/IMP cyclohydrolase [Myxococcota bacterium]|jgi:phosphoribosylaminoimidazolecarboxamide formyltransferase/IMP cyclohydrolase
MSHRVKRALLSVSDKTGIADLGRALAELGVEVLSTGGTARTLAAAGVPVQKVADVTGFPELMDGRVKTLHPRIHGAILARRDNEADLAELAKHDITGIDLVVVNLYPFRKTVADPDVAHSVALDNIDIGGPTMLRASAKNHPSVAVVVSPDDYSTVVAEIREAGGVSDGTRQGLALKAFAHTAAYDGDITRWLSVQCVSAQGGEDMPPVLSVAATKISDLRYGENPHQKAALYQLGDAPALTQHQGKGLSYNNLLDLQAAFDMCREITGGPAAVVVKHTNPCGAAMHTDGLVAAYNAARACDPISAFGGIVAVNQTVEADLAALLTETFLEVIVAPGYSPEALQALKRKKNLRVVTLPLTPQDSLPWAIRRVDGGLLVQEVDIAPKSLAACEVATTRKPTQEELTSLQFAWQLCKHVKSNAILFARDCDARGAATAAVGAGQMSRVDAVKLARMKATASLAGSVLASDAFFPFRDGVDAAHEAGATAIVQPGGSKRDKEVIDACNEHGMAMVFTGQRHFRH